MSSKVSTIHLTGRPPVVIQDDEWPVVARVLSFDGETAARSKARAWVRVRMHADARTLVYGLKVSPAGDELKVGYLLEGEEDAMPCVVRACQKACEQVGLDPQPLFDDLPAERL